MTKKAKMIADMTDCLVKNISVYEEAKGNAFYGSYYGALGIGQQQSKTGLKRQIQNIRAELLELEKMLG